MVESGQIRRKQYDQESLLADGSVHWEGVAREEILNNFRRLREASPITFLKHPEVRYEVTDHCNADCIMCPREVHKLGRPHGIMNLDNYRRSIDEVVGLGCKQIVLTGFGEPLVDKTLEQKVEYAKGKGLRTYIITNGSLLTADRSATLIESGLDELRLSFYGMQKSTYEKVMVGLNFETTMRNMEDFFNTREFYKDFLR